MDPFSRGSCNPVEDLRGVGGQPILYLRTLDRLFLNTPSTSRISSVARE